MPEELKLPKEFPNTNIEPFVITSPKANAYNCIAWAYEDNTKWYWPDEYSYWPDSVIKEATINALIALFQKKGYEVCNNYELESNYKKVAIYADSENNPTHAARPLANGDWTSKLGRGNDVTHTIESMANGFYGNVKVVMKKANH